MVAPQLLRARLQDILLLLMAIRPACSVADLTATSLVDKLISGGLQAPPPEYTGVKPAPHSSLLSKLSISTFRSVIDAH
jgi:hypothetical protein